jgi:phosphate/sulfate permease
MKTFHLIKGKVSVDNENIITDKNSTWDKIKGMVLTLVGGLYLYDRISLQMENEQSLGHLIFISIVYGVLALFLLMLIYLNWIKTTWSNKIKIENLSRLTINLDEDTPRNIEVELKGRFSSIGITFRKTENDYQNFIEYLKNRNSKFIIRDERI